MVLQSAALTIAVQTPAREAPLTLPQVRCRSTRRHMAEQQASYDHIAAAADAFQARLSGGVRYQRHAGKTTHTLAYYRRPAAGRHFAPNLWPRRP
jgi:hypothetical protein